MNSTIFIASIIGATAGIFVLYFLIHIFRKWTETRWVNRNGTEAEARILEMEVINEQGRYLPFVRLKLEIHPGLQNSFITEADTFFSVPEIPELATGNIIRLKYNPSDTTQVQIIKETRRIRPLDNLPSQVLNSPNLVMMQ